MTYVGFGDVHGQIFKTVMLPVDSPVEITNPVPARQAWFPQVHFIETNAMIVWGTPARI